MKKITIFISLLFIIFFSTNIVTCDTIIDTMGRSLKKTNHTTKQNYASTMKDVVGATIAIPPIVRSLHTSGPPPETATMFLLGLGLLGIAILLKKRLHKNASITIKKQKFIETSLPRKKRSRHKQKNQIVLGRL